MRWVCLKKEDFLSSIHDNCLKKDRLRPEDFDIDIIDIPTIGPKTVEKIITWLITNEEWVMKLPIKLTSEYSVDEILTEKKKVCVTGKLDMTRSQITEHLDTFGYSVTSSVTKDCYALIYGDTSSSKFAKAHKYGIKTIDYWENKKDILKGHL